MRNNIEREFIILIIVIIIAFTCIGFYLKADYNNKKDQTKYSNPKICTYVLYNDISLKFTVTSIEEKFSTYGETSSGFLIKFESGNSFILIKPSYTNTEDYKKLSLVRKGDSLEIKFKGWKEKYYTFAQPEFEIDFSGCKLLNDGYAY